jgi:hypothetical protein
VHRGRRAAPAQRNGRLSGAVPMSVCGRPLRAHRLNPLPADLRGEHRTEAVPPKPHRLMADAIPRSCRRSSTWRRENGNFPYIIPAGGSPRVSCRSSETGWEPSGLQAMASHVAEPAYLMMQIGLTEAGVPCGRLDAKRRHPPFHSRLHTVRGMGRNLKARDAKAPSAGRRDLVRHTQAEAVGRIQNG